MNIRQVKEFFIDKENAPCPLTERLVKAGYQQINGGYIARAKKRAKTVDYTKNEPTQYWHLFESYLPKAGKNKTFGRDIQCGELIFWMAEVSDAVPKDELEKLLEQIIASGNRTTTRPRYDRNKWNRKIQQLCFDAIVDKVEATTSMD